MEKTIWISHSAISDFESCPRLYYLRNIYRDHITGKKMQIVSPHLSLGSVVHKAIESLNPLEVEERERISLLDLFERIWKSYGGERGGFKSAKEEEDFKKRGLAMIGKAAGSPLLKSPTYKMGMKFPKVKLFNDKEIILTGSIDWIEQLEQGFHIIDFKTGNKKEKKDSLQLPIYHILAKYSFKIPIKKVSYWYLETDDEPVTIELNNLSSYASLIKNKAVKIYDAIANNKLSCNSSYRRCFHCAKYDKVLSGKAKYIGLDEESDRDLYFIED